MNMLILTLVIGLLLVFSIVTRYVIAIVIVKVATVLLIILCIAKGIAGIVTGKLTIFGSSLIKQHARVGGLFLLTPIPLLVAYIFIGEGVTVGSFEDIFGVSIITLVSTFLGLIGTKIYVSKAKNQKK